jgi:hypothetical protein
MEMNGFKEMCKVTTRGEWLSITDFFDLTRSILGNYIDASVLRSKAIIVVIQIMMDVKFVELNDEKNMIRIQPECYDSI